MTLVILAVVLCLNKISYLIGFISTFMVETSPYFYSEVFFPWKTLVDNSSSHNLFRMRKSIGNKVHYHAFPDCIDLAHALSIVCKWKPELVLTSFAVSWVFPNWFDSVPENAQSTDSHKWPLNVMTLYNQQPKIFT